MRGAVMAHPDRASEWFASWDRVYDDGCGLVENFCRTLVRAAEVSDGDWAVMAQDDAEPLTGLVGELPRLLSKAPTPIVSGYSMRWVGDVRALDKGVRWRRRRRGELLYTVFLAVQTPLVPELVAGVQKQCGPHDDERLSHWLDDCEHGACWALPNWVQHRGVHSLTGKGWTIGGRPRVSPTFPEGAHAQSL